MEAAGAGAAVGSLLLVLLLQNRSSTPQLHSVINERYSQLQQQQPEQQQQQQKQPQPTAAEAAAATVATAEVTSLNTQTQAHIVERGSTRAHDDQAQTHTHAYIVQRGSTCTLSRERQYTRKHTHTYTYSQREGVHEHVHTEPNEHTRASPSLLRLRRRRCRLRFFTSLSRRAARATRIQFELRRCRGHVAAKRRAQGSPINTQTNTVTRKDVTKAKTLQLLRNVSASETVLQQSKLK